MNPSPHAPSDQIHKACQALANNRVVAMPTETVYGLAARIDRPVALEKIFQIKGRPSFDPLIVHVASRAQAKLLAKSWPKTAEHLAKKFWPGPLTLVVPKGPLVSDIISSGLDTVGLRMPNHPIAIQLLESCQQPLAAPSANRFGRTSPTLASHVESEFPEAIESGEVLVLDGGLCQIGVESTVVLCEEGSVTVLRPGGIPKTEIESAFLADDLHVEVRLAEQNKKAASPGHTDHHYMPSKPLTVYWGSRDAIDFHRNRLPSHYQEVSLPNDSRLAARELYASLRSADQNSQKSELIIYRDSQNHDLWEAIDDRLQRAATYRIGTPTRN